MTSSRFLSWATRWSAMCPRSRHAKERGLREGLSREIWQGAVVLFREQLHDRPDDRRSHERNEGHVAGYGRVRQAPRQPEDRRGTRAGLVRRVPQSGAEHLRQEGREEEDVRLRQGRTVEHG